MIRLTNSPIQKDKESFKIQDSEVEQLFAQELRSIEPLDSFKKTTEEFL